MRQFSFFSPPCGRNVWNNYVTQTTHLSKLRTFLRKITHSRCLPIFITIGVLSYMKLWRFCWVDDKWRKNWVTCDGSAFWRQPIACALEPSSSVASAREVSHCTWPSSPYGCEEKDTLWHCLQILTTKSPWVALGRSRASQRSGSCADWNLVRCHNWLQLFDLTILSSKSQDVMTYDIYGQVP